MDADSSLPKIYDEVEQLQLSYKELRQSPNLLALLEYDGSKESLDASRWLKSSKFSRKWKLLFSGVLALFLAMMLTSSSVRNYGWRAASEIVKISSKEFAQRQCLLGPPDKFMEWFRPIVNCSMCRNLDHIDEVSHISSQEFTSKYAYTSRPVVVRGALTNWSASSVFSFDYFRQLYLEDYPGSLDVLDEHCQFFKYKTEFNSLREVLAMSKDRYEKMWYIGFSNCDVAVADALRRHYARPSFLPAGSESSRFDWIFMGRPGYGAHMHVDNVGRSSWQAQIRGIKEWTLEPPPECYFECKTLKTVVKPNDIIVVDTDTWYHSTLILGTEISITIGSEFD